MDLKYIKVFFEINPWDEEFFNPKDSNKFPSNSIFFEKQELEYMNVGEDFFTFDTKGPDLEKNVSYETNEKPNGVPTLFVYGEKQSLIICFNGNINHIVWKKINKWRWKIWKILTLEKMDMFLKSSGDDEEGPNMVETSENIKKSTDNSLICNI